MPQDTTLLRLFVALPVPDNVREQICKAQEKLRCAISASAMSWTRPEQFHLTLKFLGAVEAESAGLLSERLRAACSGFGPFPLACGGAGFFPSPRRPRVVWVGLKSPGAPLETLHKAVDQACEGFTLEKPEDRFHAHVTIGRVKQVGLADVEKMTGWAASLETHQFGEWTASEALLMKSQLSPKGATHTALLACPFNAKRYR